MRSDDRSVNGAGVQPDEPTATEAAANPQNIARRAFVKRAAAGAGVIAGLGKAHVAVGQQNDEEPPITIPQDFDLRNGPPRQMDFPMTGAEVFAKACKDEGLAALFCCPGNYQIVSAISDVGIPSYGGRNEGSMASAADAFIRVTGEIAACSGTEGPGFTLMISAIVAANASRTPMLLVASNMSVQGDDTEANIQRGYQQPTTEGIKKYGKRLITANRIHEYAGYAFRQLRSGVPGPVHLDFTTEVTNARFGDPSDLEYYHDKTKYRTDAKPYPDPKATARAAELIRNARRPMIVASTGVFYSRAWEVLTQLAEKCQILVVESGPMRGQFPDSHPLSASTAPGALPSADVVVLVGQYCMPTVGEFAFGPNTRYIRIDPDPEDIGRNLPIEVGIISDEKAALEALYEQLAPAQRPAWVAEIAAARREFEEENDEIYAAGASYRDAVHPAVIGKELGDFLYRRNLPPDQTTVVSGGFGIARYTRRWLRANRPGQIMNGAYQYGAIGPDVAYAVGVGAAMELGVGPQAPYQGSPIICVTGDAGFAFSGFEIETLASYRMPAVIIVYNNNAWGTWAGNHSSQRVAHMHMFQENLKYHKLAEALGGYGEYVRTPDQMRSALERAYDTALRNRAPVVVNCQAKKEFSVASLHAPGFLGKVEPGAMAYYH